MPPYANPEHDHSPVMNDNDNAYDVSLMDIPLGFKPMVEEATTVVSDESSLNPHTPAPSMFERLLDFNPCTIKIANPSSALFKIRTCSECGERVHKFKGGGYEKEHRLDTSIDEDTHEESSVETKVYFHGTCLQRKEARAHHRDAAGFGEVLIELQDFVEAKNQRKREEEERRARKAREEAAAVAAALEAALEAANAAKAELARQATLEAAPKSRKRGFLSPKRARRALKSFSWNSCRGTQGMPEETAFRGEEL